MEYLKLLQDLKSVDTIKIEWNTDEEPKAYTVTPFLNKATGVKFVLRRDRDRGEISMSMNGLWNFKPYDTKLPEAKFALKRGIAGFLSALNKISVASSPLYRDMLKRKQKFDQEQAIKQKFADSLTKLGFSISEGTSKTHPEITCLHYGDNNAFSYCKIQVHAIKSNIEFSDVPNDVISKLLESMKI